MDRPVKKTNLLIIRGVSPIDFAVVSKSVDEKIKIEPAVMYTEMPKKFTSVDKWLPFSNLKCWYCDQLSVSYPKFIPMNLERCGAEDTCDVHGHFDEWNCAVRYVIKEFPAEQQWDALQAISLIESKFSGKHKEKIMPAPAKTLMKAYCGDRGITQKQWREKILALNNDYELSNFKITNYSASATYTT